MSLYQVVKAKFESNSLYVLIFITCIIKSDEIVFCNKSRSQLSKFIDNMPLKLALNTVIEIIILRVYGVEIIVVIYGFTIY